MQPPWLPRPLLPASAPRSPTQPPAAAPPARCAQRDAAAVDRGGAPGGAVAVALRQRRVEGLGCRGQRGRVGRGKIASQCWLVTAKDGESPRVEALVSSTDGFVLAEEDLRLRGEGTIMGVNQKGRSDLTLASLQRDLELIQWARDDAQRLIESDPMLKTLPVLRDELDLIFSEEDEEFLFKS